jgi:hypothetical protein
VEDVVTAAGPATEPEEAGARQLRQGVVSTIVLAVLAAGVLMAVPGLRNVSHRLEDIAGGWIALAIVLELLSCLGHYRAWPAACAPRSG